MIVSLLHKELPIASFNSLNNHTAYKKKKKSQLIKNSFFHVLQENNGKADSLEKEASGLPQGTLKKNGDITLLFNP